MKLVKVAGVTSEIWQLFIRDSSSATGAGLTGLAFGSAGLTAYFHRDTDTTATAISLVTMTVGTFTSSGFAEVDATNMPGVYQFCPPNTVTASGAKSAVVLLKGATNMAPLPIEVQLTAVNVDSATAFMTSVGSVTGAVGSVTGAVGSVTGLTASNLDATISSRMATYAQPSGFLAATFPATVASPTNITAGTITTVTNLTNAPTVGDLTAAMKASVNTEVLDVLTVDTFAEPSGVVAATATMKDMLNWIKVLCRNKITQTSTTQTLRNNADTSSIATATVSDTAGTSTRAKWT